MRSYVWQHIIFEHGGNPYICKTAEEFYRIVRKYNLEKIKDNFWFVKNK